jgi:hypothetical protein
VIKKINDYYNRGSRQESREMYAGFWWGNLKERHNSEDLGVDGIILK